MQESITNRLNISLITEDDKANILKLRNALEQRLSKRLPLAEVVRIAIHNQAIEEQAIKANKI